MVRSFVAFCVGITYNIRIEVELKYKEEDKNAGI